jgi:hypothetical protein
MDARERRSHWSWSLVRVSECDSVFGSRMFHSIPWRGMAMAPSVERRPSRKASCWWTTPLVGTQRSMLLEGEKVHELAQPGAGASSPASKQMKDQCLGAFLTRGENFQRQVGRTVRRLVQPFLETTTSATAENDDPCKSISKTGTLESFPWIQRLLNAAVELTETSRVGYLRGSGPDKPVNPSSEATSGNRGMPL